MQVKEGNKGKKGSWLWDEPPKHQQIAVIHLNEGSNGKCKHLFITMEKIA